MMIPKLPHFQATFEQRIDALARLSETPEHLTRPSLTHSMRQANDLVSSWMQATGMTTREDHIGSLIGRYEGTDPHAKTLVIGSHLDTVIDAGKYDGTLGVLLGLACVEALASEGIRLPFAIEVVGFCDEEGLRFHLPYLGSKAFVGALTPQDLARCDNQGMSIADAVRAYGADPDAIAQDARRADELLGYLEVHIEQGPVLETHDLPLGVVTGIAGMYRVQVVFTGEAGHAGTVPMALRRDALVAGAKFVLAVQEVGLNTPDLVATVGHIEAYPGASNAVPGKATLTLDVRHLDNAVRQTAYEQLHARAQAIATAHGMGLQWDLVAQSTSIPCSPRIIEAFSHAIEAEGIALHTLSSGAGHDGVQLSRLTDIGMLFVRCRGGISHNPAEFASASDVEIALRVLLHAVLALA